MINHTIQPENVKRFVNLKHPDGVKCISGRFLYSESITIRYKQFYWSRHFCPMSRAALLFLSRLVVRITPAAESHGLWPWMNAPTFGRDVAPLGC
jgi:hypothetical protein